MATMTERAKEALGNWKPTMVLQRDSKFTPCRVVGVAEAASFGQAKSGAKLYSVEYSDLSSEWVENPTMFKIKHTNLDWINGDF